MSAPAIKSYCSFDLSLWLRSGGPDIRTPVKGEICFGKVPVWLAGKLIMNGPGGKDVYGNGKDGKADGVHVFDCPGLLQQFEFTNGQVYYDNRFVNTKSHQKNTEAGRLVLGEFGTTSVPDPCLTIFRRFAAAFTNHGEELTTDTNNISIHPFGDQVYSLSEYGFAHEIDLETLETIKAVSLKQSLGIITHTAHIHVFEDLKKVYLLGMTFKFGGRPNYAIVEIDTGKKSNKSYSPWSNAKIVSSIPSRYRLTTSYMHSFSITENYFIMIEQPLCMFLPEVPINLITGRRSAATLKFYSEEDTLFHVVPRNGDGAGRKTFRCPSFCFMHTINAFEKKDGTVVVDICCYKDGSLVESLYFDILENGNSNPNFAAMVYSRPYRYLLNVTESRERVGEANLATREKIVDFGCEVPTINRKFNGKKYNYFYAISSDMDLDHAGWVVKVDTVENSYKKWGEPELNSYGSEPIFIPSPGGKDEDDGLVLSALLYGGEDPKGPNRVSVVILGAKRWELLAKVDFHPGQSIPKCLHGWYFPTKDTQDFQHKASDHLF